ncbi:DUF2752 domain-containing protein [Janibacter sp. G349]|mgnify:FL=1|uniref:DUF2752 domain-containing protein n=1 Tax=unclassified Janibacter TaxID=2649294 RepID=UPI003B78E50B
MTQQVHGRVHLARGVSIAERWVVPVVAAISLFGLVIARLWPVPSVDGGTPTCLMRTLTGLPCPGCGMTRSWVHLAHGDVATAFEYNLFGPVAMAAAAGIVVWTVYALVRRVPTHSLLDKVNPRILLGLTVLWLAYSAVRIISLSLGQDYFALVVA